jgi:hypothetical protein
VVQFGKLDAVQAVVRIEIPPPAGENAGVRDDAIHLAIKKFKRGQLAG